MNNKNIKTIKTIKTIGEKCIATYPDRIPIVVHHDNTLQTNDEPKLSKLLVPNDITVGNLLILIRRNIKISYSESLYIFIDNKIIASEDLLRKDTSSACIFSNKLEKV